MGDKNRYDSNGGCRWNKEAGMVKERISGCVLGNYWRCKECGSRSSAVILRSSFFYTIYLSKQ